MREKHSVHLSVIITVYSETKALAETVERLLRHDRGYINEIILIVSPRSSARCLDICAALAATYKLVSFYRQEHNPGVGRAVRQGMNLAEGEYIALMSADLETEPEAVDRMVKTIEKTGCDAVIASRWLAGGGFKNYKRIKLILNWTFQNIFKRIYGTEIGDLTFGLKIIKKELVDAIAWEGTFHEIFIETTLKPLLYGADMRQVPTVWSGRKEGASKNSFWINWRYVWLAVKLIGKKNTFYD